MIQRGFSILMWTVIAVSCAVAQGEGAKTAEARARRFALSFGHSPSGRGSAVLTQRQAFRGPSISLWEVTFDKVVVALSERGELYSFRYLEPGKLEESSVRSPEPTEEESWQLAEKTLAPLGVPPGLYRSAFFKTPAGTGTPGFTTLVFEVRPHGYAALGGNIAMVGFHNASRQVRTVQVSRHWTYERPQIRISASKAKEIVADKTNTKAALWQSALCYVAEGGPKAPKAIRELCFKRTMRLCYELRSNHRGTVIVDSVTGEVVRTDSTMAERMTFEKGKPFKQSLVYKLSSYVPPLSAPPVTRIPAAESAKSQSPDAKIVRAARDFAVSLGHVPQGEGVIDKSDIMKVLGRDRWKVVFEDASVTIDSDMRLRAYNWSGRFNAGKAPKANPLVKESDAWALAEKTLARYQPPKGLTRNRISGLGKDVRPDGIVYLHFQEKPYGYQAEVGNLASVSFRIRDRQLLSIHIGRDWTYEPPNIKISKAQAIEIAAAKMKAPKEGWKTDLKYWREIKTNPKVRVSRLCYVVYSKYGFVEIDSVTGEVTAFGTPPVPASGG